MVPGVDERVAGMNGSLVDVALQRFNARVDAVEEGADEIGYLSPLYTALVMSGLDLDLEQANERMHDMAHAAMLTAALSGKELCSVLTGVLVQAMALGVLHERARAEQDRVDGGGS